MSKAKEWKPESLYNVARYFDIAPRRAIKEFKEVFWPLAASEISEKYQPSANYKIRYTKEQGEYDSLGDFYYWHVFLPKHGFEWEEPDLINLLNVYDLALELWGSRFKETFLDLKPGLIKKRTAPHLDFTDERFEVLRSSKGIIYSVDPEIIDHFEKLGFGEYRDDVFFNFNALKEELLSIQRQKIVDVDFVNAIDEILAYHRVRMVGRLVSWRDQIKYSDRMKSRLVSEKERYQGRELRKKMHPRFVQFMFNLFLNDAPGRTILDLIDELNSPDKFDSIFFKQNFPKYIRRLNPKCKDSLYYSSLYNLFALITRSSKFTTDFDTIGYGSDRRFRGLTVKRLLQSR